MALSGHVSVGVHFVGETLSDRKILHWTGWWRVCQWSAADFFFCFLWGGRGFRTLFSDRSSISCMVAFTRLVVETADSVLLFLITCSLQICLGVMCGAQFIFYRYGCENFTRAGLMCEEFLKERESERKKKEGKPGFNTSCSWRAGVKQEAWVAVFSRRLHTNTQSWAFELRLPPLRTHVNMQLG